MTCKEQIFVTGLGAVTPLGNGIAENWNAVCEKRTAISPITRFDLKGLACANGGQINLPEGQQHIAFSFALQAVREAIAQAGADPARLGLITGSNFGEADRVPDDHARVAAEIAAELRLGGPVASVSLSCSSGASALALAADWISCGHADSVVVVGVDAISLCSWSGLCSLRTMARDAVVKPFDVGRGGTVFAEGAAAVLIEKASLCAARNAKPLAELSGWATGNNGFHLTAPPKRAAGSYRVMRDALADADTAPAALSFITAHATATHANDLTEAQAISDLVGEAAADIPVTGFKASAGHLLGAAGSFEAAMTVMAIAEGAVPPLARTPETDPEIPVLNLVTDSPRPIAACCAGGWGPAVPDGQTQQDATTARDGRSPFRAATSALTDSAGFGGCNAALVFKSAGNASNLKLQTSNPSKIAVLSSGFLSAMGIGTEEAAATWAEGESACFPAMAAQVPEGVTDTTVGEVPEFDPATVLPTAKAYLDRQSLLAMSASALALQGLDLAAFDKERFGISHGTAWGAATTLANFYNDCLVKGPRLVKPMLFPHTYANAAASLISIEWELRGFHANYAGGRSASSFALLSAVDALRRNECDAVLAGGSEALSVGRWAAEAQTAAALPPGEGAAMFVLEKAERAALEGRTVLGYITGTGVAGQNDVAAAVKSALDEAVCAPAALQRVFASDEALAQKASATGLTATASVPETMTGFCGGASAAIQLACALLEPESLPALILTADASGTILAFVVTAS